MDDFIKLDTFLSEEERLIRDTVRRFVDEEVIPLMSDAFEQGIFPTPLIQRMADLGLFGLTLPTTYGCAGANYVSYGLVCQELERGDSALRSLMSVQSSLVMYPLFALGSETQKQQFLPQLASGKMIGCYGLTEADSGSDPSSMKTFAKKVADGWILNGSKMWITNAPIADIAIVWAKTDEGIRGFIVEKSFKGFIRNEIKHKMSLRASLTGELVFEDVFIPKTHILPGSSEGLGAAFRCLSQARYGIAWGAMGAGMACYESALSYALTRKQFNQPIASFQLIQKDLVDMLSEIVKTQCLNYQIGRLMDVDSAHFSMISLAKMSSCRAALDIARQARNILGANGISLEYPVIRHMNNLESVFTYEGTDNIHHLIIGRYITGINAIT